MDYPATTYLRMKTAGPVGRIFGMGLTGVPLAGAYAVPGAVGAHQGFNSELDRLHASPSERAYAEQNTGVGSGAMAGINTGLGAMAGAIPGAVLGGLGVGGYESLGGGNVSPQDLAAGVGWGALAGAVPGAYLGGRWTGQSEARKRLGDLALAQRQAPALS
jgi:hypothetical protein